MKSTINHHLTDDVLFGYAAGSLPEAFNLMVASHISLCDECRAAVESYDAVGGTLVEQEAVAPVAMTSDALNAVLGQLAEVQDVPDRTERVAGVLPAPLQDYVGGDLDAIRWKPLGMGVRQAILPTTSTASARLLFIPAGTAMPDHGHKGMEMTMVLKGAFVDEHDYFGRGDVEMADEDLEHTPVADMAEDCICLAVADAPLKFKGLVPRLLQPLFRI